MTPSDHASAAPRPPFPSCPGFRGDLGSPAGCPVYRGRPRCRLGSGLCGVDGMPGGQADRVAPRGVPWSVRCPAGVASPCRAGGSRRPAAQPTAEPRGVPPRGSGVGRGSDLSGRVLPGAAWEADGCPGRPGSVPRGVARGGCDRAPGFTVARPALGRPGGLPGRPWSPVSPREKSGRLRGRAGPGSPSRPGRGRGSVPGGLPGSATGGRVDPAQPGGFGREAVRGDAARAVGTPSPGG